jgi:cell division protein FtsI/penicillin-binding protein 2
MSYIIRQTGEEKFLRYFHQLGLDRKTGIDLPGEARPVQKDYWPEIDLATASFGQGFAITQIQMITAFNTIANNGVLVGPHFNQNQKLRSTKVYEPTTITLMKDILEYGVDNGAVAKFKPKGMVVCGKSGTSQVAVKGGYSDSSTIASYIGFSPCDQPKYTMIVTVKNPRTSPWGSSTAAPIWYKIAEKLPSLL